MSEPRTERGVHKGGKADQAPARFLRLLDYLLLVGIEIVALLGLYFSVLGLSGRTKGFTLAYSSTALAYAALTGALAVTIPPKAGLPVLPLFENWAAGILSIKSSAYQIVIAVSIGAIAAPIALYYDHWLIVSFGAATAAKPRSLHWTPNLLGLVCAAILEEVMFRGILLGVFAMIAQGASRWLTSRGAQASIWIANASQALLFGASHIATGNRVLSGRPLYLRIPLVSQTWTGIVLGCVYARYGIEAAVLCHTSFDLVLLRLFHELVGVPP